ncbi:cytoglobin-2 [Megalopta genalis]|uniref:cytoglobin-2 n=1 Tax=Megalopta genalis TaxID=115081 RepID=UPI0014435702|nr:cytoglobin-2-like [Megalopta genalis]XP_033337855.1 cytoglobin-2-like [Megalopta genalis]
MASILRYFGYLAEDNRLDEATGLTDRQKRLVQNTWTVIKKDQVNSGVAVMIAYFTKYPVYQQEFQPFKDMPLPELPANKKFQAHCANIIAALNSVIDSLHDPGLMDANLIMLAERHKNRGQTEQQFQDMKQVILDVFRQILGKQFTPEVAEAWNITVERTFSKICNVLAN